MNIETLTFEQFTNNLREIPELEKKFRSAMRFFREQTCCDEETTGQKFHITLFTLEEIADLRDDLKNIENQSMRIDRNETLINDKVQEFVNDVSIKEREWQEMINLIDFANTDFEVLLDQKTTVVQV
jgi:hypothetical protein